MASGGYNLLRQLGRISMKILTNALVLNASSKAS